MTQKHILVVEDDEGIRKGLFELLDSEGYVVKLAANGMAALEVLANSEPLPSLILLDLMMPGMDGFGFREAQEKVPAFAQIPVVIMTADGHIESKRLKIGAVDFIRKPVDINEILEKVERYSL